MDITLVAAVVAGIVTGLAAAIDELRKIVRARGLGIGPLKISPKAPSEEASYAERVEKLTGNLTKASRDIDTVLTELAEVARNREARAEKLEAGVTALEETERKLKERIEDLEDVPPRVAEHFAQLMAPAQRRSAIRDYSLFGGGVVLTTIVALVIQVAFG